MATPMQEQYLTLKKQYPDCILLFRLGDFYEGFNEDAKTLSKVIGLTLTGRGEGENRVPMAGIPHHALQQYLPKLIKAGLKVAIADQLEDPKPGQLVKRDVTKVITAGTIIDENSLDDSDNNYLASIYKVTKRGVTFWGLSFADISTGEFKVAEYPVKGPAIPRELIVELFRIRAAELVLPNPLKEEFERLLPNLFIHGFDPSSCFEQELLSELLKGLHAGSFKGFGLDSLHSGLIAAGKLYEYLKFNRKSSLPHISSLQLLPNNEYMLLDEATIRNLELIYPLRSGNESKTLFGVLNNCQTPMGQRRLRQWLLRPLLKAEEIQLRLDAVAEILTEGDLQNALLAHLNEITDLERVLAKVGGRSANARDLVFLQNGLKNSLQIIKQIKNNEAAKALQHFIPEGMDFTALETDVIALIVRAIKEDPAITITEGDIIREGYNSELDELKSKATHGKTFIKNLEQSEIKKTGINNLKVRFNRVFGYYIEVSKSNVGKVPQHYIRKQTTVNGERYITSELKEWEDLVLNAQEKINKMEFEIFEQIRGQILNFITPMQAIFESVSKVDVLVTYARNAQLNRYVKPVISEDLTKQTSIIQGRHPVVETYLHDAFVPNNIEFNNKDCAMLILTGPNMSGKSTFIRQTALIMLMAQIGSYVPAEKAELALADRIFTRVGASDNLAGGESTFMVEMSETANILNNATERSLVILDEVGRGTSTYDGVAIAWAVVEHLVKEVNARTLFATHYHELLLLEDLFSSVKNYKVEVLESEGEIKFMHRIVKGGIDKSYGIHVAGLAGVPNQVVKRAVKILEQLQKRSVKNIVDKQLAQVHDQMGLLISDQPKNEVPEEIKSLIEELKKIDINNISPLEGLTTLKKLQDTAHGLN